MSASGCAEPAHPECAEKACVSGSCDFLNYDGPPCDDGDPCTELTYCNNGVCLGSPGNYIVFLGDAPRCADFRQLRLNVRLWTRSPADSLQYRRMGAGLALAWAQHAL